MQLFHFHRNLRDKLSHHYASTRLAKYLSNLFNRIFHRQAVLEKAHIRRVVMFYLAGVFSLSIALYFTYSYDLYNYSQSYLGFTLASPASSLADLSSTLTSSYAADSAYSTWVGELYTISLVSVFLFTLITSLYLFLKYWHWNLRVVAKRLVLFVAFQLFYLLPLAVLIYVPDNVVDKLIKQERATVDSAIAQIEHNPSSLGLITDPGSIVGQISSMDRPPTITLGDYGVSSLTNYLDLRSPDTFVRVHIIPYLVATHSPFQFSHSDILFPNHTISLNPTIEKLELEQILSTLAIKSFTSSKYASLLSKSQSPSITLLTVEEYNDLENKKLAIEQAKIEKYLDDIASDIVANDRYIAQAEIDLQTLISDKSSYQNRVNPLLSECLTLYGEEECLEAKNIISATIQEYDQVISNVETNLNTAKSYKPSLLKAQVSAKQTLANFLSFPIIPELQSGIFEPPSTIQIKYDPSNYSPPNYFYTLLHELAHYYSYNKTGNQPSFIEEGITDYLSLKVGESVVPQASKVDGYPYEIEIAHKLVEILGEEKVLELYFAKSPKNWTSALAPHCGSTCYLELAKIGEQLTYSEVGDSDTRQNLLENALSLLSGL